MFFEKKYYKHGNQLQNEALVTESQLLEKFQVEELEKRYEFGWVNEVRVEAYDWDQPH